MPSQSNIQLAVSSLLSAGREMSMSNVFTMYATIAGHDSSLFSDAGRTVLEESFERALEKHALVQPLSVSPDDTGFMAQNTDSALWAIRHQYWYKKLGQGPWDGKGELSVCEGCGRMKIIKDGIDSSGHGHNEAGKQRIVGAGDNTEASTKKPIVKKSKGRKGNGKFGTRASKSKKERSVDLYAPGPSNFGAVMARL